MVSGLPWGLALSSGVNTYLPLFLLALFARFGHVIHLSPRFQWIISDQAIFILGALALCEILAQKFPMLDNTWDFVHTVLRPMAGALAAGAALDTNNVLEIAVAMLMGGTLAAAAHSAKSGLRLASTSKSLGLANSAISLGEDAGVLVATLLSIYAPWVMLAIVIVFAVAFALIGPRIYRTLAFDVGIVGSAITRLFRWIGGKRQVTDFKESLWEFAPERLETFKQLLDRDEDLLGGFSGWKRSLGGPRRTSVLLTAKRLLWIESRILRKPKIQSIDCSQVVMIRHRSFLLFSRAEFLTHRNENYSLTVPCCQIICAELAVQAVSRLAPLNSPVPADTLESAPRLVALPR